MISTKEEACQILVVWVVCQVASLSVDLAWEEEWAEVEVEEAWVSILTRFLKCSWEHKCKVVVVAVVEMIHSLNSWVEGEEVVEEIPLPSFNSEVRVVVEEAVDGEGHPFSSICEYTSNNIINFLNVL